MGHTSEELERLIREYIQRADAISEEWAQLCTRMGWPSRFKQTSK